MMAEAARWEVSTDWQPTHGLRTLSDGECVAGRYEIRRFVARGGMGEVYEAFDSILQERVALKTLVLTALDQQGAADLLLREVRIARRVVHPNVCRILDVGFHHWPNAPASAVPFLTMDFLVGETLACRIARVGRLQPAEAFRLLRQLTSGLGAVHRAGIIHRDLKSENVFLVGADDRAERAIVMDFGLARALELHAGARRSSSRAVLGTADYMAPEQVEGRAVTAAADVYALGVVTFEMVVGRTPFSGDSPAAVALSRLTRDPPRASALVPDLDRGWDRLIARCLAREPERRFAGVDEFTAALDEVEHRRSPTPSRSRRRAVGGATAAVFVAVAAVSFGSWRGKIERRVISDPTAMNLHAAMGRRVPTAPALRPAEAPQRSLTLSQVGPSARSPSPQALRPRRRRQVSHVEAVAEPDTSTGPEKRAHAGHPDPKALLEAAEDLLSEGKIAEACGLGDRLAATAAASADIHRFLGRCYMRLGQPARARAHYQSYLDRATSVPDASFVRAMAGTTE